MWSSMVDGRTIQLYYEYAHTSVRNRSDLLQEELIQSHVRLQADLDDLNPGGSLTKYSLLEYIHRFISEDPEGYGKLIEELSATNNQITYKDKKWFIIDSKNHSQNELEKFKLRLQEAFKYLNEVRYFQIPEISTSLIQLHNQSDQNIPPTEGMISGLIHLNISDPVFGHIDKILKYGSHHFLTFFLKGLELEVDERDKEYLTHHFGQSLKYFFYERLSESDSMFAPNTVNAELVFKKIYTLKSVLEGEEIKFTKIVNGDIDNEWLTEILMKNYPREGRFDVYSTG